MINYCLSLRCTSLLLDIPSQISYRHYYFHHAWHLLKYFRVVLVIEVRSMDEFFKGLVNRTKYFEQIEQFKDIERKSK